MWSWNGNRGALSVFEESKQGNRADLRLIITPRLRRPGLYSRRLIHQLKRLIHLTPESSWSSRFHYALIVTPTATKEKTTIKIGAGQTMLLSSQNGTWYDNPSFGMSFYNLQLTEASASYLFDNEEGLIVYGYGFGSFISYYYMAASSIRQLNPSFYINDVHFQNANGQTYCNGSFKFKAELNFPLSANPGHIKWYVNGVEEPTAQDKIEWTKSSFPLKTPQEIKLVVIGEDGKQLTIKSTAN